MHKIIIKTTNKEDVRHQQQSRPQARHSLASVSSGTCATELLPQPWKFMLLDIHSAPRPSIHVMRSNLASSQHDQAPASFTGVKSKKGDSSSGHHSSLRRKLKGLLSKLCCGSPPHAKAEQEHVKVKQLKEDLEQAHQDLEKQRAQMTMMHEGERATAAKLFVAERQITRMKAALYSATCSWHTAALGLPVSWRSTGVEYSAPRRSLQLTEFAATPMLLEPQRTATTQLTAPQAEAPALSHNADSACSRAQMATHTAYRAEMDRAAHARGRAATRSHGASQATYAVQHVVDAESAQPVASRVQVQGLPLSLHASLPFSWLFGATGSGSRASNNDKIVEVVGDGHVMLALLPIPRPGSMCQLSVQLATRQQRTSLKGQVRRQVKQFLPTQGRESRSCVTHHGDILIRRVEVTTDRRIESVITLSAQEQGSLQVHPDQHNVCQPDRRERSGTEFVTQLPDTWPNVSASKGSKHVGKAELQLHVPSPHHSREAVGPKALRSGGHHGNAGQVLNHLSDVLFMQREQMCPFFCIGEGGFGKVYMSKIPVPDGHDIPVAVKVLKEGDLTDGNHLRQMEELLEEATILARLKGHPNIVQLYGLLTSQDACGSMTLDGIVMELCTQGSLRLVTHTRQVEGRPFSLQQLLNIIIQICEGMIFMHAKGVAHFDLKLANILVSGEGACMRVKLADFGLSKGVAAAVGYCAGTASHMAPEMLSSPPTASAKSDVYSFGVLCWELMAASDLYTMHGCPLSHEDILAIRTQGYQLPIPATWAPWWRGIITACTFPSPEHRPSFHELAPVLQELASQLDTEVQTAAQV